MEVIVSFFRLVYHDAASIGLELEVADAVKFYILYHVGILFYLKLEFFLRKTFFYVVWQSQPTL